MPVAREFEKVLIRLDLFDDTTDRVVASTEVTFRLEFKIGDETELRALDKTMVAELVLHLAEEDASCIHIRLCDEAV